MSLLRSFRRIAIALSLVLVLLVTPACGSNTSSASQAALLPSSQTYSQLERGDTAVGQKFGDWVIQTSKGLIKDAYVRDTDKLGVVISPQVRPTEVRSLAQSLVQGFHKNFPNRDLKVLIYAPDKERILTANYNNTTRLIEYES
ncbi:MAG: hypothetical protein SAJ12_20485 [Jaaginema sp. PMC 1079.18]|nr:hypothetical protein [Jaaginema sp. PMC 1080.18]MEC4853366.1 hypothetical protein [Jaaginema sp. PMC 1079.18]MEC4867342.1 hypothetical protein [Jaaginema sp. PMC 1078.18]